MRIPYFSLLAASALALGGCAYDEYGMGLGYGGFYGDYGGPWSGHYGYGGPWSGDYGYGYGAPYFGWYDDSYYPGAGIYVYDSYRRPHMWNDRQRTYWTNRQQSWKSRNGAGSTMRQNWSGFSRRRERTS